MASKTLLPSAAYTSTQPAQSCVVPQQDYNGWTFTVNVTAAAVSGGMHLEIYWTNPLDPAAVRQTIYKGPTFSTVGTYNFVLQPGVSKGTNTDVLATSLSPYDGYTAAIVHADATNSFTYSHVLNH